MTIDVQRINSENFRPFGSVARPPGGEPLAADETFEYWSDVARFEIPGRTEIGYCKVYERRTVEWMEQHVHTPEILIPADRPFILPVMSDDGRVAAFEVDTGVAVVIGKGVWHSACLPVGGAHATYFVIFRRGTPHEDVAKREIDQIEIAAVT